MCLTSPPRPHHKFVRADILLLADAMVENDFSEDEEIEEEEQNEIKRLTRIRDSIRRKARSRISFPDRSHFSLATGWVVSQCYTSA